MLAPEAGVRRNCSLTRDKFGEVCAVGEAKRHEVINLEEFVTYVHDHLQETNLRDPASVDILNAFDPQSTLEGKVRRYTSFWTIQQPFASQMFSILTLRALFCDIEPQVYSFPFVSPLQSYVKSMSVAAGDQGGAWLARPPQVWDIIKQAADYYIKYDVAYGFLTTLRKLVVIKFGSVDLELVSAVAAGHNILVCSARTAKSVLCSLH